MPDHKTRCSGVLAHPTSFPSHWGIGDLGPSGYAFVDFLKETGQQLWQVLPLGPTSESPYSAYSSIAGNPLLICLDTLQEQGLLPKDIAPPAGLPVRHADFAQAKAIKTPLLKQAFAGLSSNQGLHAEWMAFCEAQADWLEDFALFISLKEQQPTQHWNQWEKSLVKRSPGALEQASQTLREDVEFHQFCQFAFYRQWSALVDYAHANGVRIVGDIPFYVAYDSADVWANPANFALDPKTAEPKLMAGVPPDYFSATGQLWGNPVFDWAHLKDQKFDWWVRRFKKLVQLVDIVRIDHFRGFEAFWEVPQGETTAVKGRWAEGPGGAFFETLERELGHLPIWAEDLGLITDGVEKLRNDFHFPGMNVLQFAFDEKGPDNPYLPFNHRRNSVVYTGTHDNNTCRGWWQDLEPADQQRVEAYFDTFDEREMNWVLIRLAMSSVADSVVVPLQDVLGLDGEARMNTPGRESGNWGWRYEKAALTTAVSDRLAELTLIYGRAPSPEPSPT